MIGFFFSERTAFKYKYRYRLKQYFYVLFTNRSKINGKDCIELVPIVRSRQILVILDIMKNSLNIYEIASHADNFPIIFFKTDVKHHE